MVVLWSISSKIYLNLFNLTNAPSVHPLIISRRPHQPHQPPQRTIPHHTTQNYTTPHHTTPHQTTPHHTTPHHTTPHHTTPRHTTPPPATTCTNPGYFLSISCICLSAFSRTINTGSEPMHIKCAMHCGGGGWWRLVVVMVRLW